ncbi:Cysteine proteinase inhibitor 10 [Apostasia shenzhenica]|uniref:Cysteine proteinase inhibitor 10 n=1 Tax=Apostasia shenzhenica TaxID=1088818 RepID=A0A2I0APK2_9ASPA|nr:Cysteine proteinase inhibitor 10 [Apostasia shenzhenica]
MASPTSTLPFSLLMLLTSAAVTADRIGAADRGYRGRKVGGWTEIPDAGGNREVRDLSRFSVSEYNRVLRGDGDDPVAFSGVLSAHRQVVAGIKYRIRIATVNFRTGDSRSFDAVVVVRPWLRSRDPDLLSFTPASPSES